MSSSQHSFLDEPRWTINGTTLNNESDIKYLGTTLGKNCGSLHIKSRINSANRAFYSLQGAGLYYDGVSPRLAAHIYNTAVRSGMVYGCHAIHLSQLDLIKLNKAQAKYVRTALGLRSYCHVKPVLQALGIKQISDSIALSCIDLLRVNLRSGFYKYLFQCDSRRVHHTLVSRVMDCCRRNNIDPLRYVINHVYRYKQKRNIISSDNCDNKGLLDSLKLLFDKYTQENVMFANILLKAF